MRRLRALVVLVVAMTACSDRAIRDAGLVGEWRLTRVEGGWLPAMDVPAAQEVRLVVRSSGRLEIQDSGGSHAIGRAELEGATYQLNGKVVTPMRIVDGDPVAWHTTVIDLDSVMAVRVRGDTLNLLTFADDMSDYVLTRRR